MYIHSYQIHNVLNVYRKRLSRIREGKGQIAASKIQKDKMMPLSSGGKRQTIMNQVAENVFNKITTLNPKTDLKGRPTEYQHNNRLATTDKDHGDRETTFRYNTLDTNDKKVSNSVKNSNDLIDHLNHLDLDD